MNGQRRGFSLIELLVVASIFAILIALLAPSLRSMNGMARQLQCGNNLSQIGIAYQLYANDHSGWYPVYQRGDWDGNTEWHEFQPVGASWGADGWKDVPMQAYRSVRGNNAGSRFLCPPVAITPDYLNAIDTWFCPDNRVADWSSPRDPVTWNVQADHYRERTIPAHESKPIGYFVVPTRATPNGNDRTIGRYTFWSGSKFVGNNQNRWYLPGAASDSDPGDYTVVVDFVEAWKHNNHDLIYEAQHQFNGSDAVSNMLRNDGSVDQVLLQSYEGPSDFSHLEEAQFSMRLTPRSSPTTMDPAPPTNDRNTYGIMYYGDVTQFHAD